MSTLRDRVSQVENLATEQVEHLARMLREAGWDFVCISIARRIQVGTEAATPGACTLDFLARRMGPALPNEARALRQYADRCDEEFRKLGCAEGDESYIQDIEVRLPTAGVPQ